MISRRLEDWLQIIGLFGIVGSLIFVGLQMKQDREIALSEIWQARTAAVVAAISTAASNEILMSSFAKNANGNLAGITPVEEQVARWHTFSAMFLWESSHYQYTLGFMPEEHWMRVRNALKVELQNPFLGPMMLELSTQMRPSFAAVIEDIHRELVAEKK